MLGFRFFIKKLKGKYHLLTSKNISKKSFFANNTQFLGIDNITIGENCTIGENTRFTVNDRNSKDIKIRIKNNVYIGRNNFFTVGGYLEIKEYCIFGDNCSFLGSNHTIESPLVPYAHSGATLHEKITIGVNCWFGINSVVIGNVTIGHGCVIGANTLITKDIPPFSIVVGNPSRIIKRFDFFKDKWVKNLDVPESIYSEEQVYLKFLTDNYGKMPLAYYSSSSVFGNL
jgi:acetyltransferase-like isoleucine patch superfamily enzyme